MTAQHLHRKSDAISKKARAIMHIKVQETYAAPRHPDAAPPRTPDHSGTYDGAELRPYTGRPGAMDAYAIKSRD